MRADHNAFVVAFKSSSTRLSLVCPFDIEVDDDDDDDGDKEP